MLDNDFVEKVAIVTGGGSVYRESLCRAPGSPGAKVVVADWDLEAAEKVAADLGPAAVACHVDVSDPSACQSMVDQAVSEFGKLDVAVNNAGIGGQQR